MTLFRTDDSNITMTILPFNFTLLLESVGEGGGPSTVVKPLRVPSVFVALHVYDPV